MSGCSIYAGTQLTIAQAVAIAQQAGFTDPNSLTTFVAVLEGESNLYTHAVNQCDPNGGSFGIAQINAIHWGAIFGDKGQYVMSQTAAFDPQLAMLFAYSLSSGGKDFTSWGSYTDGSYAQYLQAVSQVVNGATVGGKPGSRPPNLTNPNMQWILGVNLYAPGIRYRGNTPYGDGCPHDCEGGVDITEPGDTPIYALGTGMLVGSGTFTHRGGNPGYGVVTELIPGVGNVYYQHININPTLPTDYSGQASGYIIHAGDLVGWTRADVGEVEVGINPGWGGIWGANPPGPWLDDPRGELVLLAQAAAGGAPYGYAGPGTSVGSDITSGITAASLGSPGVGIPNPVATRIHNTLVQWPGLFGICDAIDEAEQFPGIVAPIPSGTGWIDLAGAALDEVFSTIVGNTIPLVVRGALILVGIVIILGLFWQLAKPNMEALSELMQLAPLAL